MNDFYFETASQSATEEDYIPAHKRRPQFLPPEYVRLEDVNGTSILDIFRDEPPTEPGEQIA